jgi:hypothetical protein
MDIILEEGIRPVIAFNDPHIAVPLRNHYPVITPHYAIIPSEIFNHIVLPPSLPYPSLSIQVVHQTFETRVIPPLMNNAITTWKTMYPYHHYHTTIDQIRFLTDHFDSRVINAYQSLLPGAFQADLWRVALLYYYGGIYADVKMVSVQSLEPLLRNHDIIMCLDRRPRMIFNAIVATRSRHPFFKFLLDYLVHNIETRTYGQPLGKNPLNITGPGAWYAAFANYVGLNTIITTGSHLHPDGTRYYLLHHQPVLSPSGAIETNGIVDVNNTVYVRTRDPIHPVTNDLIYQCTGKESYTTLYNQGKVYR